MLVKEINRVQEPRVLVHTTDIHVLVLQPDQVLIQELKTTLVADHLILELIEVALPNAILQEAVEPIIQVARDQLLNRQEVLQDLQEQLQTGEIINHGQPNKGQLPTEVLINHREPQPVVVIISQDQLSRDRAILEVLLALTSLQEVLKHTHNLQDLLQGQVVLLEQEVLHLPDQVLQDRQGVLTKVLQDLAVLGVLQEAIAVLRDHEPVVLDLPEAQVHQEVRVLVNHLEVDRLLADSIN